MGEGPSSAIGTGPVGKGRTLLVCCVQGGVAPLQPAIDVLSARGFEITVVEGQDVRPPVHAQRHGADALYVLARMTECPSSVVLPLEGALRSAAVPAEHILEVAADWRDPMALVERVHAIASASPSPANPTSSAPILRTSTASHTAGRRDSTGPQRTISLVSARTDTGSQRAVSPSPPPAPEPIAIAIEPTFPAPSASSYGPLTEPQPSLPLAPEPVLPDLDLRPSRLHTVTAALRTVAAITEHRSRAALQWVSQSRPRMLAVASALAVSVVVIALLASRDETAKSTSADDRHALLAKPAFVEPLMPKPESADARAGDASDAATRADEAAIVQARASGKLGVYEGIVFAPKHSPKRTFGAAQKLCADMNAGPIKGWRMPELGELHELAVAQAIGRGVYWAGTEADAFGSRALIWSEKKTTAAPITKSWGGARALCVRDDVGYADADVRVDSN